MFKFICQVFLIFVLTNQFSSQNNESNYEILENNFYFIQKVFSMKQNEYVDKMIEDKKRMDSEIKTNTFSISKFVDSTKTIDYFKKNYREIDFITDTNSLSQTEYFNTPAKLIPCSEHLRILALPFVCVGGDEQELLPDYLQVYVIKQGSQKYYLRIDNLKYASEIEFLNDIKATNNYLNLVKYKIVNGRFIGIYEYRQNDGLLDVAVRTDSFTKFDKYNYMLTIAKSISDFYVIRDPKNPFSLANIHPQNILLDNAGSYDILFLHESNNLENFKKFLKTPEDNYKSNNLNQKSRYAYILGKVFYFILFNKILDNEDDDVFDFLLNYDTIFENKSDAYDFEIMDIVKGLLNFNASDRPSFSLVIKKLTNIIEGVGYLKEKTKRSVENFFLMIKNEGDSEVTQNIIHLNNKKIIGKINNSYIDKKSNSEIVISNEISKQNFIDFYTKKLNDIENENTINGLLRYLNLEDVISYRKKETEPSDYYSFEPLVDDEIHYKLLEAVKKIDIKDVSFTFYKDVELKNSIFISTILKKKYLEYVEYSLAMRGYYKDAKKGESPKRISITYFFDPLLLITLIIMFLISFSTLIAMYSRKNSIDTYDTSEFQLPIILD